MGTKIRRPCVTDKRRAFRALHRRRLSVRAWRAEAGAYRGARAGGFPEAAQRGDERARSDLAELADLGSVGDAVARVAWSAAIGAAKRIKGGSSDGWAGGTPGTLAEWHVWSVQLVQCKPKGEQR